MSRFFVLTGLIALFILSCRPNDNNTPDISTHGLFEFPDELWGEDDGDIPSYLDPEEILCNGKGIKVANCISRQLKEGVCLGIIKHQKRVYAIEIPCDDIKRSEVDSVRVE